ncbi:MAG: hypothetical protein DPW09_07415 [Anaerolineae bacterium]|nr:protein kinase [Anaerolineales bacterium]MCQ3973256.1 hypothetical protein [Anaerolineae bacterium]
MKVKIWGARGSIPSPIRPDEIREKIISAILSISQIEKGELKEELLAAILEETSSPSEISSGQSVNLSLAKTQVKRRQVVRAYLDTLSPFIAGTAGGNTPCVEVQSDDDLFIIDAGSGIRALGLELMKGKWGQGRGTIHLFFSHPHWDHIQGFPFFRPAFVRGNKIFIYGVHDMEAALRRQQEFISFPVSLDYMQAEMKFIQLKQEDVLEFGDLRIRTLRNHHPGEAYSFRFEKADKVFVYASDASYPSGTDTHPALNFFADADMLIYDSQFTQKESDEKEDWGHSSSLAGVEMAQEANVRNLVLFHYDPTYTDRDLEKILEDARKFQQSQYPHAEPVNVMIAQEGLTFDLTPPKTTQLQQVPGGKAAILKPAGIFNERVAAELKRQLAELKADGWPPHLIVDMAGVEMLQVSGLRALVKLRREQLGTPMVLAGPSINVQQVIELAGYLDFFAIYPSVHAALSALQARETLNLPGQTIKNRYFIESKIGDGRLGTSFKAMDNRLNRPVVIKILSASFSEAAIERFLQQARELINLIHPNIVDIYDCDEDQGLSYMVEEYVEGQSLPDLLNAQPGQPLPLDLALTIAEKLARALEYAHARGVIHGDLKPKNILITADEIKISDFGLGRLESSKSLLNGEDASLTLVTARYLAPEQILGHPIDARTDLYTLGIILYEMFTGQPLFEGTDQEVMERHRSSRPRPLRELNPTLSRSLEYLVLKLLDKDPNKRYATARLVRRILTNMTQTASRSLRRQALRPRRWPALVGRQDSLQSLLNLWAATLHGQGQLVLISGEAGSGKTRLTQELADRASQATVLLGGCRPSESSLAYQPFIEALKTYFATTPTNTAEKQVSWVLEQAAQAVPEIQQILPDRPPTADHRPPTFSLAELIGRAAANQPWLIILDDLQWADPNSLQLLDYLARCCRDMAVMIVGVYRSSEADRSPLAEALQRWSSYPAYTSIALGPLAEREVAELLENIWTQAPPADLVGAVYRRSQGNPLFVEEIAKSLVDDETVNWREGRWYFSPVVEAGLPQQLGDAVLRRVNRLSKETQALLYQAAVLGYTFTFDHLQQISELSDGNILEGLDTALERQLIRDVPLEGVMRFNHHSTQEMLYQNLSPLKQRLIHREVGETLEQSQSPFAAELAHHFFQAQELEKGLTYSIQAAAQARALYASPAALFWTTQALQALDQLGPSHSAQSQRFELLLAREQLYDSLDNRPAQANDLAALQALVQALDDPAKQVMVHNRQAQYERALKQLPQAAAAAQAALLAARQIDNTILEAESLIQLAYISAEQGHLELSQAHGHDAREFLEGASAPQAEARSLNCLGDIYRITKDYPQAEKYYRQALALSQSSDDRLGEATSLANLGSLLLETGDFAAAAGHCRQALELSRLIGQPQIERACLKNLGRIDESSAKTIQ